MHIVDNILNNLQSYRVASETLGNDDCSDELAFRKAWENMEMAQDVLLQAAPAWFRDAVLSGELYGTDLAGDPSCCSPDEVSELCAMLAISTAD